MTQEGFMTDKTNRLFNHLHTTHDFLLAKTGAAGVGTDSGPIRTRTGTEAVLDALLKAFPDLLTGRAFMEYAMGAPESVDVFFACAIRIGLPAEAPETDNLSASLSVAGAVDAACRREGGIWGMIDSDLFGCFFPDKTGAFHKTAADLIRNELPEENRPSVVIGTAFFPSYSFSKTRILENACKAVDHACFFGPDSTVAFDDVSLNISGDKIFQSGDIHGAIEEYKTGLEMNNGNINLRNSLGVCYGLLGRLDLAKQELKAAVACNRREVMSLYNLGLVHMMQEERKKALKCFQKAQKLDKNVFEINHRTGQLLLEMGDTDAALPHINRAIELDPASAQAFRSLGDYHLIRGQLSDAVAAYKKAIKLNPNDAAALSALGAVYDTRDENTEIATLYCEKSVQLSPEDGLFHLRLGRLYLKEDRMDEARLAFKAAADLGQTVPELAQDNARPQKAG
jgi:tetratricopeptide (TPR) repeat protein